MQTKLINSFFLSLEMRGLEKKSLLLPSHILINDLSVFVKEPIGVMRGAPGEKTKGLIDQQLFGDIINFQNSVPFPTHI
jgi:hypothetical protein